jgi:hypothetical protein
MTQTLSSDIKELVVKLNHTIVIMPGDVAHEEIGDNDKKYNGTSFLLFVVIVI